MSDQIRDKVHQRRRRQESRRTWLRRLTACVLLGGAWLSSGCRAEQPWELWNTYANKYLDKQGRVIDHSAGDVTTSEGEAYAMFFALVANDRPHFDILVNWTEANLAQGDLTTHLPAWKWGKASDGGWHVLDPSPASDANLWMAYSLSEAGRLWKFDRYEKLGRVMAEHIASQEIVLVPNIGPSLLPGPIGFHPNATTYYLNPSYMPPSLLAYFGDNDPVWHSVAASLPKLVVSPGGFVMDWISAGERGVAPMPAPSTLGDGKPAVPPQGSHDAIRTYLWMGIADPKTPAVRESLAAMSGMADYLRTKPVPPRAVDAKGVVLDPDGPSGFSAAVIPYLHALHEKKAEQEQTDRLAATKKDGLYGTSPVYYDQNLAMFSTGWQEGRYRFDEHGKLKVKWK
ncbi:MAG: cellulose synthase complex periplasmic endoglucanase BcsZ [Bryocella sp.]